MKRLLFPILALLILTSVISFAQPNPPTNLTATVGNSMNSPTINLAWQYDSASNHVKYAIYKKLGSIADTVPHFFKLWTTLDKHFVDYSVRPGQTVSYYVTATIEHGSVSAPSNIAEATVPAPTFGLVSGTVVEDSTAILLNHSMVSFIPAPNSTGAPFSTRTDSNGYFKARVKTGNYFMYTSSMGHFSEYYDNAATVQTATPVTVNENDSLGFTISLGKPVPPTFGIVSGIVTEDGTSAFMGHASVTIFPSANLTGPSISVRTDSNGFFKARVKTGNYFMFISAHGHVSEYFDNSSTVQGATAITVNENDSLGYAIGLAQIAPPAFGILSGVVKDDSSGAPVPRSVVHAISVLNSGTRAISILTDSNGYFKLRVKTGAYILFTSAHGFVAEYFDNALTVETATQITVADGDSLGYEISLAHVTPPTMYSLSGLVTDGLGNPMKTAVTAYLTGRVPGSGDHQRKLFTTTDSLGYFSITAKENDTLVLFFVPMNNAYVGEFWNNQTTFASADRIAVTGDRTDLNVELSPLPVYANGVSGLITDSAGTTPLKAFVHAYRYDGTRFRYTRYYAQTDTLTGSYSIESMKPGTYILLGWARGYKASYYRADGTPTLDWKKADTIVVTETGIVTDLNFHLNPVYRHNASIFAQGKVNSRTGTALDGAVIYAVDEEGMVAECAVTEADGSFEMEGLKAGTYSFVSNLASYTTGETTDVTLSENTEAEIEVVMGTDEVTGVIERPVQVANAYTLTQNYPNPFNPSTTITYVAPSNGFVTVKVYNVLGNEIATLVNGDVSAGEHTIHFDGSNLSTGVYYVKLEATNFVSMKKMLLVK